MKKIEFLPEDQKIANRVKELMKQAVDQLGRDDFGTEEALQAEFNLGELVLREFPISIIDIPEFKFDYIRKAFGCTTGEYIFFIKKIGNSLKGPYVH